MDYLNNLNFGHRVNIFNKNSGWKKASADHLVILDG